jgi:hypothetical protein
MQMEMLTLLVILFRTIIQLQMLFNQLKELGIISQDAFVTKLNPLGNALVYSTYLGGGQPDNTPCYPFVLVFLRMMMDLIFQLTLRICLCGRLYSCDRFPTVNAYQSFRAGSSSTDTDAFIAKFTQTETDLYFQPT